MHGDGHTETATVRRHNDRFTFNKLLHPAADIFVPFSVEIGSSQTHRRPVVLRRQTGAMLRDAQTSPHPEDSPDANAATFRFRDGDGIPVLTIRSFDD